jgi:endonuclease-3
LCPSAVVKKEVVKNVKKVKGGEGEVKSEVEALVKEEKADESAPLLDTRLSGALSDIEDVGARVKQEEV